MCCSLSMYLLLEAGSVVEGGALPQGPWHSSALRKRTRRLLAAVLSSEALEALRLAELLVLLQERVLVINNQLRIKSDALSCFHFSWWSYPQASKTMTELQKLNLQCKASCKLQSCPLFPSHLLLEKLGSVEGVAAPQAGLEGLVSVSCFSFPGAWLLVGVCGLWGALRGHGVLVMETVAVWRELLEVVPAPIRHLRLVYLGKVCFKVLMLRRRSGSIYHLEASGGEGNLIIIGPMFEREEVSFC